MKGEVASRREFVAAAIGAPAVRLSAQGGLRPNFIVVVVDDLRWDDLGCAGHPFVKTPNIDRISREGAMFENFFAVTPLCSPSRASILTGQYPRTHGIIDNTNRSARSHELMTFPRILRGHGYETAFAGKWHMGNDDTPRPGFDYWACLPGQGESIDPEINENGQRKRIQGYVTDILTERAARFLRRRRPRPFLLYLAHKALHPNLVQRDDGSVSDPSASRFIPAERHRGLYANAPIQRRPNALRAPEGKPALLRPIEDLPPLGPATGTSDETIRDRLRMLAAVDEGLGGVWKVLEDTDQLDNTVLIFTSDNGYFYGEHGLSVERRLAYEESIRLPLLIRYPARVRPGSRPSQLALIVDLAPTVLDLAGIPVPKSVEGRPLAPVLGGAAKNWRTSFLIEHHSDNVFARMRNLGYQAVRTERHKYIRYNELTGMDELYDLEADPYEMRNLASDPAARPRLKRLGEELNRLLSIRGGGV
jgi:arylsulfatase A-like enzyme